MKGKVYFVSAPGRIKIGYTANPQQRLVQLQTQDMEKLSMLNIIDGPRQLEHRLHLLAAPYRVRREWYRDCPEVHDLMARAISGDIEVEVPTPFRELSPDLADYYDLKRLPILEARALASRLYREFLEEILAAIERRKLAGKPFDDLLYEMKKIDPDFIAEKHKHMIAA